MSLTVVSRSRAAKRSSWAAADFSKASCFLIRFSTSSIVCCLCKQLKLHCVKQVILKTKLTPSSLLVKYDSCAISQPSATAASRANWYTSRTGKEIKNKKSGKILLETKHTKLQVLPAFFPSVQHAVALIGEGDEFFFNL